MQFVIEAFPDFRKLFRLHEIEQSLFGPGPPLAADARTPIAPDGVERVIGLHGRHSRFAMMLSRCAGDHHDREKSADEDSHGVDHGIDVRHLRHSMFRAMPYRNLKRILSITD